MGKRRRFTDEFKLEAVKLIKDGGVPFRRASRDLGFEGLAGFELRTKVITLPSHLANP